MVVKLHVKRNEVIGEHGHPGPLIPIAMELYRKYFGEPRASYGDRVLGTIARGRKRCPKNVSERKLLLKQAATVKKLRASTGQGLNSMFGPNIRVPSHNSLVKEDHKAAIVSVFQITFHGFHLCRCTQ